MQWFLSRRLAARVLMMGALTCVAAGAPAQTDDDAAMDDDDAPVAAPVKKPVVKKPVVKKSPVKKSSAAKAPARKVSKRPSPSKPLPASRAVPFGIYFRIQQWFFNGSLSISQEHFVFWPDGRVYFGVPKGGLEGFNFAAARQKEPKNCGTYNIQGDQMLVRTADGKDHKYKFARAKDGIELDGIYTSRQRRFKANQRLNQTYDGGASARGAGSYVASAQTITFRANGTFQQSRIGSVSADTSGGTVSGKSESATSGSYSLGGHTLTLRHKNGVVTRHTVYPFDLGKGRTAINIDGAMLHPPDRK